MTHAPNTPRERNSKGQKVDEGVQCVQCLQAWPCEVMLLTAQIVRLDQENQQLRTERDDLRELNIKVMAELRECHEDIEPDDIPGYQGETL